LSNSAGPARAAIRAIAGFLPERVLDNEHLADELGDWTADKIREKTGIRSRRVAGLGECASDLAVGAAQRLFESGACAPEEVDFLLVCTQTPDHLLPTTACLVQERLGLPRHCGAVDVNQGCSGYVYSLALAKGLVENGLAGTVLVLTADTYTRLIHPQDRSVRTLFGDGAAATLVAPARGPEGLGPFVFGTDGRGAPNLIVPAGGMRNPATPETAVVQDDEAGNRRSAQHLFMNGPEVFAFTLQQVPRAVNALLARAGLASGDVARYVFHQANAFMLECLRGKLGIPPERFSVHLEDTGNTVSASIPLALEADRRAGLLPAGAPVVLVGFGVGYSWAAALASFGEPGSCW